jgi:plasmid maintenance system antidote protein VapI
MILIQEKLRKRLLEIKETYGTTFSFIAKEIGVHRSTISLFVANNRNLPKPIEIKLEQFLNKKFNK